MNTNSLYLFEDIMLLSLQDKEGTVGFGLNYHFALGGAILAELLLKKRIGVEESKKKKFVRLNDSTPIGDPLLDECLEKIRLVKKRATYQTWVSKFANMKDLKHRVANQLCMRGILKADEEKVLLLFTRRIYPEINPTNAGLLSFVLAPLGLVIGSLSFQSNHSIFSRKREE